MAFEPRIGVAILGGGKGVRFGGITPKPLVHVLGHPLIYYSLKLFSSFNVVSSIAITFPEEHIPLLEKALQPYGDDIRRKIISGGETRALSSMKALETLKKSNPDIVIIHDAVRPCISSEEVVTLINSLTGADGAFLGVELSDTIWKTENDTAKETLKRENLVRAFTPQAFYLQTIYDALKKGLEEGFEGTDDASFVVRNGGKVICVFSSNANIKVTYPKDIEVVEAILSGMPCA
ncbi:MAG: 2-C-methyl-D-erythritol 4-phosphate cytidylyltransferase [Thermoanaerobaculaceae bacterium]|nr:2-C-methyl-D-erythritol 4-phosphate cytidylyltransferase [Thermoanaerobaculaceae bacterium]